MIRTLTKIGKSFDESTLVDHEINFFSGYYQKHEHYVKDIVDMYHDYKRVSFELFPAVAPRQLNRLLSNQSLFVYCDIAEYFLMATLQIIRAVLYKDEFMELITEI